VGFVVVVVVVVVRITSGKLPSLCFPYQGQIQIYFKNKKNRDLNQTNQ